MNLATLSEWSQVAASFAVLATLVYLTIQVRQSAELARAASRQAMMAHTQQEIAAIIERPEIMITLAQKDEPTQEAALRVWGWLTMTMRAREHEWLQYRAGVLDKESWTAYMQVIPIIMTGTPRARRWWVSFGQNQFHPEFCRLVEDLMRQNPDPQFVAKTMEFR